MSFALDTILLVDSEEDDPGNVVVEMSTALAVTATVEIRVRTGGGTATENMDYTLSTKTLTFAAGETEKRIEVSVVADMTEGSGSQETFILELVRRSSAASLYELGSGTKSATTCITPRQRRRVACGSERRCGDHGFGGRVGLGSGEKETTTTGTDCSGRVRQPSRVLPPRPIPILQPSRTLQPICPIRFLPRPRA